MKGMNIQKRDKTKNSRINIKAVGWYKQNGESPTAKGNEAP
jgi:hypothetical protein